MPFSIKHIFSPGEMMIARRFQENFDQIVSELNAFPITGKIKPSSIATANIKDNNVTAYKFASDLQFMQIPKGPATTDPSNNDHLCRKAYVYGLFTGATGLISDPTSMSGHTGGESAFSASTASFQEYEYFFQGFRFVYGYTKRSDMTLVSGNAYYLTEVSGLTYIFAPMIALIGSGLTSQKASLGALDSYNKYVSYTGSAHRIFVTFSSTPDTNLWGVFYGLLGRETD